MDYVSLIAAFWTVVGSTLGLAPEHPWLALAFNVAMFVIAVVSGASLLRARQGIAQAALHIDPMPRKS